MAVLDVLRFPDERLRTVAAPVDTVDDAVRTIIKDMFDTMYDENGVGLAATQVDIHQQIIVMDTSDDRSNPIVLINPKLTRKEGAMLNDEGCLSVPNCYAKVERAEEVTVEALDENGELRSVEASELLAICIQHEMDHLIGKLFVDYLSPLKRDRIKKKLEKEKRLNERNNSN